MTVGRALRDAAANLGEQGAAEARSVAELLLAEVLACPPLELPLHAEDELPAEQGRALAELVRRAAAGLPVQYVLGKTEFMGHVFRVDPRVLIPRPDTERLVELVLACPPLRRRPRPVIVDVGTGSGCIVISLALGRAGPEYQGVDVSADAIRLARENAAYLGVAGRITFRVGDLLAAAAPGSVDAVVANLPYIRRADLAGLPRHIRDHEPRAALDGGADGLDLIRRLAPQAWTALRPGGFLFLEIGCDQGAAARGLLEQAGFTNVRVEQDLGRRDRVVWGHKAR